MTRRVYTPENQTSTPVKNTSTKVKIPVFWIVFLTILLGGSITCASIAFKNHSDNVQVMQVWDDVRNRAEITDNGVSPYNYGGMMSTAEGYTQTTVTAPLVDPMDRMFDWDYLSQANSDTACWLYIPDTPIDYPVMQEQSNGSYFYLNHDFDGSYLRTGSLFIPRELDGYEDADIRLLIFGHNTGTESLMFCSLINYKEEEYYLAHPYIYVYYPDRVEKWQVWAANHVVRDYGIYDLPLEANTQKYADIISYLDSNKYYEAGAAPDCSQRILTLSTCDRTNGDGANGRFIVNAVLVDVRER